VSAHGLRLPLSSWFCVCVSRPPPNGSSWRWRTYHLS